MVERKRGEVQSYNFFKFCKNCCHSATNLPKSLCFRRMRVVAARWQVAAGLVTSNDSPNAFTTVKTAFSCGENAVFQRRKRRTPAWQHTHYAQHPPSLSGRGWGWGWLGVGLVFCLGFAATLPPSATTSASPLYKGFQRCWWQSGSKNRKKIFYWCPTRVLFLQHLWH